MFTLRYFQRIKFEVSICLPIYQQNAVAFIILFLQQQFETAKCIEKFTLNTIFILSQRKIV